MCLLKMEEQENNTQRRGFVRGCTSGAKKSREQVANQLNTVGAFLARDRLGSDELEEVGAFLYKGTAVAVVAWAFLLFVMYKFCPPESFEELHGVERSAAIVVTTLLTVTNGSRIAPLFFRENSMAFMKSGILVGCFGVQLVAIVSNALPLIYRTPIMMDEVVGIRSHQVRNVEWVGLTFLMTFLTEAVDIPLQGGSTKIAWMQGLCLAVSSMGGFLFPFCRTFAQWSAICVTSMVLFCSLYVRIYQRYRRLMDLKKQKMTDDSLKTQESYNRAACSYKMIWVCGICWTNLVVGFIICCFAPSIFSKDHVLSNPTTIFLVPTVMEMISKIWYLSVMIDVYDLIFNESARARRRLEDLRQLMTALWDSSSDIFIVCVKGKNSISAVVSPAFLKMESLGFDSLAMEKGDCSLILEIGSEKITYCQLEIDLSKPVSLRDVHKVERQVAYKKELSSARTIIGMNLAKVAEMVERACNTTKKEESFVDEFYTRNSINYNDASRTPPSPSGARLHCEVQASFLESGAVLLVLRDISERFNRFQVEKRLLEEVVVRKKDAEAIRFTRHEVKNGLLAAMGVLDGMREVVIKNGSIRNMAQQVDINITPQTGQDDTTNNCAAADRRSSLILGGDYQLRKIQKYMNELDSTLREMLDKVLDDAAKKEIVNQDYEPKMEEISVPEIISALQRKTEKKDRFPLEVVPNPFPKLMLDPHLLRSIYQDALSNACKFGKSNGPVSTLVEYTPSSELFRMQVTNLPGEGHDKLTSLSHRDVDSIFNQKRRRSPGINDWNESPERKRYRTDTASNSTNNSEDSATDESFVKPSAGDGAWIIQKCAQALGGSSRISFEKDRTIFSMECPAAQVGNPESEVVDEEEKQFEIPPGTWGIAIDDSNIQRKLLDRFLRVAGFNSNRRLVFGSNSEEVFGFVETTLKLIRENPDDRFLLIVDENLDIVDGGARHETISGSLSVQKIRDELDPFDEGRVLALIRSANDSATDIELYKTRAHGFLKKASMKKDEVLNMIKPWWRYRFENMNIMKKSTSQRNLCSSMVDNAEDWVSNDDILASLMRIDALCVLERPSSWIIIRDELHKLQGDIQSMGQKRPLNDAIEGIRNLRNSNRPKNLSAVWLEIRSIIAASVELEESTSMSYTY